MSNKHHRTIEPVRNVLDEECRLRPGQPFIQPIDIICNALIQMVIYKEEDDQFTLKELVQGYCKSPTPTHMNKAVVYRQMYEQLLIRDLAYVGVIEDGMTLEDVIWSRQNSNGMYELYKACK